MEATFVCNGCAACKMFRASVANNIQRKMLASLQMYKLNHTKFKSLDLNMIGQIESD